MSTFVGVSLARFREVRATLAVLTLTLVVFVLTATWKLMDPFFLPVCDDSDPPVFQVSIIICRCAETMAS